MQETQVRSLGWDAPLEKGMTTPPQYSYLENPMDEGAWRAPVHGVAKSWTQLNGSQHPHTKLFSGIRGKGSQPLGG